MIGKLKSFPTDTNGNAGIDWIVLTAGIVMLGVAVGVTVSQPANTLAADIDTNMQAMAPTTY